MLPRRPDCAELTGPAQQRHPGVEMPGQDQTSAIFSRRQHVVFVQRQSLFAGGEGFFHTVVAFAKPFRMPDFFLLSGLFLSRVIDRDWKTYLDRKVVHLRISTCCG